VICSRWKSKLCHSYIWILTVKGRCHNWWWHVPEKCELAEPNQQFSHQKTKIVKKRFALDVFSGEHYYNVLTKLFFHLPLFDVFSFVSFNSSICLSIFLFVPNKFYCYTFIRYYYLLEIVILGISLLFNFVWMNLLFEFYWFIKLFSCWRNIGFEDYLLVWFYCFLIYG